MDLTSTDHVLLSDGDRLALRLTPKVGDQPPLLCLPGGPLISSAYLGDLGGLSGQRQLAFIDPRGSGGSDIPTDPAAYGCDRIAADLDEVRRHLGLDTVDLLAHCAGANIAYRYVENHAHRVSRLVLVTPSPFGLGVEIAADERRTVLGHRAGEAWYQAAAEAFERLQSGTAAPDDDDALGPVFYNRWDEETKAYAAAMDAERNRVAATEFVAGLDPDSSRSAAGALSAKTLVVAGAYDVGNPPSAMERLAGLFGEGRLVVQPGAGHFPWRDDPVRFATTVASHLAA